jgi:hypothetical protein
LAGPAGSKARAFGTECRKDQIHITAWLARAADNQMRTFGRDQVTAMIARGASSNTAWAGIQKFRREVPPRAGLDDVRAPGLGGVDNREFVESSAKADQFDFSRVGGMLRNLRAWASVIFVRTLRITPRRSASSCAQCASLDVNEQTVNLRTITMVRAFSPAGVSGRVFFASD